jgi:hypothetical protein
MGEALSYIILVDVASRDISNREDVELNLNGLAVGVEARALGERCVTTLLRRMLTGTSSA